MNYSQYESLQTKAVKNEFNGPYVGYLSLKEGEEALVRVVCSSINDLDIIPVHWAFVDGRERWVKCNRDPQEPIDKCQFCKAEKPLSYRVFIKLIQYVTDENGNTKALAKIWNRPASFISILKDRIDDYGPLSEMVCKVKRHGSGKSTTYDIMPLSKEKYPESLYPKRDNAFEGFNLIGHSVKEIKENNAEPQEEKQIISHEEPTFTNAPYSPRYGSINESNQNQNPFGRPQRFTSNN